MEYCRILNVNIAALSQLAAQKILDDFLHSSCPHFVATINSEILYAAKQSPTYQKILNSADLALPDSFGVRVASFMAHIFSHGTLLKQHLAGVDLAEFLVRQAEKRKFKILCLARRDGRSTALQIQKAVQRLAPTAFTKILSIDLNLSKNSTDLITEINDFSPQLVLVGLGFPYQEQWLVQWLKQIPSARIGIGVGGTFDFWTGQAKRAPVRWQKFGLEWLWRVGHEPHRIKRITRAVIMFPIAVLIQEWKERRRDFIKPCEK